MTAVLFGAVANAQQESTEPQPTPGAPDNGKTAPKGSADATASPTQTGATSPNEVEEVVVTGSRIRYPSNYTSPDAIQVITSEQSTLRGLNNTTSIIQMSTVAGNGTQINNSFTGYVVNGGPGVNTVSLRGLGADRTLVLINGQRVGPAGVSGTVGSVDLNTIPSTIIDRIEIVKDGSSSIYGSDAVAGIVNIITKQNLNGGDVHAYAKLTGQGGREYDTSAAWGKTFDRGYFNVSGDFYRQESLRLRDRKATDCTKDLATDPSTGASLDLTDPNTGSTKCYNIFTDAIEDGNTGYAYIPTGRAAAGTTTNADLPGLHRVNCTTVRIGAAGDYCSTTAATSTIPGLDPVDVDAARLSRAELPYDDALYGNTTAISPVRRFTGTASFGYSIVPSALQFYDDFLFNRRESQQTAYRQVFPYVEPGNPSNPFNDSTGDYLLPLVLAPLSMKQDVNYYRNLAGFRGDLPNFWTLKKLHYDLSTQFSQSKGKYTEDVVYFDRLNATTGPTGCDPSYGSGGSSINGGPSMTDLGDTATCVPINWAQDSFNGGFTPEEKAFLMGKDTGHTTYEQAYIQGDVSGTLLDLPAGPLGFDVGFQLRRDRINDVPGETTLEGNSWGLTSAGITRGHDKTKEIFAELSIPILKDLPFIHSLSLNASGRYSDYNSVGVAKTYKGAANWAITDWLSVKYIQGTSFRAPQLYELYLADQTSYLSQTSVDPCINYGTSNNPNIVANCASQGIPATYAGTGSSALISTGGGSGNLRPETSLSKTVGIVLTPKWFGLHAGIEVDYYENHIKNGIQEFGAGNIVNACYNSNSFPNNGFCDLFTRDLDPSSPSYLNILSVEDNYVNVASVMDRGIDATFFFEHKLPYDVKFRFDSQLSWTLEESTQLTGSSDRIDYNGTVGTPSFVGNLNFRFDWHDWTFNWFTNMVGKTSDYELTTGATTNYRGTGLPANFKISVPFYAIHTISVRKSFGDDFTITAGLINAFDKSPPEYSYQGVEGLIGSVPLSSQYDYIGRAGFIQLDKKF